MFKRFRLQSPWLIAFTVLAAAVLVGAPSANASEVLKQTYTFEPPVLGDFQHENLWYTSISSLGSLTLGAAAGAPALPVKFVQILLPPGREIVNVEVSGSLKSFATDSHDLSVRPIFPYQKAVPIGFAPPEKLAMDQALYSSSLPYPAEDFSGEKVGFNRGYAIFSMGLNPVKYIPATGQLSYYSEMTVSIEMKDTGEINPFLRPGNANDRAWVQALVTNPDLATIYHNMSPGKAEYPGGLCDPADDYDYVIITTTQNGLDHWDVGIIPYNWDSLMTQHTVISGLSCNLVTIQQIMAEADYENANPTFNDQQARIREFCKDAYQDWNTDYIMIGGDAEWIPARQLHYAYEGNVDSDIYWNHLDNTFNDDGDSLWGEAGDDGFDLYAEMYIGRITADIPQDVSNWLTKCFYYMNSIDPEYIDNAAFYGGDTGWSCQGDDFVDFSAIKGTDNWLGPDPSVDPYPSWLGFQYGFDTWNSENPGSAFDMDVKWTAEPPNAGWTGGSSSSAINGLRNAISNDECTLISAIAHANEYMSMDVYNSDWENNYHNTKPFFLHDYGCHCGDMDAADDGVLHSMLLHSDTELAFAFVCNTGYGWGNFDNTCSSSSLQQKSFWDYMFDVTNNSISCDNWQLGKAMAYSRDLMAPTIDWDSDGTWRGVIECCLLFGDPALNIMPPAEPAFFVSFPFGLPSGLYPPGPETTVTVQITDGDETYVQGSGLLYYRFDSADPFSTVTLTAAGGDLYEGVIPNTRPGDEPEFYFFAEGDGGTTVTLPATAPAETYSFDVCFVELMLEDNFETATNWTVTNTSVDTGAWERANPEGTEYQPEDDHSDPGTMCYVTGPLAGSSGGAHDLDGGPTRLTSPVYDLSSGDAEISFYLYFYHSTNGGQLPLEIDISNNGISWTRVENVTHSPSWNLKSIQVSDHVTPTANIQLRFSASDNPNDSIVEALLDDLSIQRYVYDASLWADGYSVEVSTATQIGIELDAGVANGNRPYLLLGTLSGTSPGYTLPGGAVLPLNWDAFTDLLLGFLNTAVCQDFYSTLDGMGQASAALDTLGALDPALVGETANFAYTLGNPFDFASNAISVTFEP